MYGTGPSRFCPLLTKLVHYHRFIVRVLIFVILLVDRLGTGASEEQPKFTDLLANPSFDADNSGWIEDAALSNSSTVASVFS